MNEQTGLLGLARFRSAGKYIAATCLLVAAGQCGREERETGIMDVNGEGAAGDIADAEDAEEFTSSSAADRNELEACADSGVSGLLRSAMVAQFQPSRAFTSEISAGTPTSSGLASPTKKQSVARKLEQRAFTLLKDASFITQQRRFAPAVSALAFYNEFALGEFEAPDFVRAERLYNSSAASNCSFALARLAFLKMQGRPGIKINQALAEHYRAVLATNAAAFELGAAGISGSSSLSWIHILAVNHHPSAQFCLGICLYNGIGTVKNKSAAYTWCRKAALQNHPGAMNMLGNLFIEGHGTTKQPAAGLRWYIRAAELKDAAAIYNIGTLFERGVAVEEDARQAFEWYVRASVFGSVNAQNVLGIFYEQGIGVPMCSKRAVQYYKSAAGNGHPHAMYNLARCHHDGFGVVRSDSTAAMWFQQAAQQAHVLSLLSAAVCHDSGVGMPDGKRVGASARDYYWQACKKGSAEARFRLVEVVALEMLVAARPLLAGRMIPISTPKTRTNDHTNPSNILSSSAKINSFTRLDSSSYVGAAAECSSLQQFSSTNTAAVDFISNWHNSHSANAGALEGFSLNKQPDRSSKNTETEASRSCSSSPSMYLRSHFAGKSVESIMYPSSRTQSVGANSNKSIKLESMHSASQEIQEALPNDTQTEMSATTSIAHLPTEILLHVLSFLNPCNVLTSSQVLRVLEVAGDRGTLSQGLSRGDVLKGLNIERVAVWIDGGDWCRFCRGKSCTVIKHHVMRLKKK
ncbi:hypothetical protein HDU78_000078 [Chytriomyces hyalinus]|nr:hypothetical protein HDU78_000078 [Chytriomyces hyalinus]